MSDRKEIDKAIGRYLEEVAAQLAELPPDEKDSVLRDVESHVYAALEKAGENPTLADLNLVLAQMDPPSAWGESVRSEGASAPRKTAPTPQPRVSKPQTPLPPLPLQPQASAPRMSLFAVAAGITAALTFLSAAVLLSFGALRFHTVPWQPVVIGINSPGLAYRSAFISLPGIIVLVVPWMALAVLTTVLGLLAVSGIRASRGRLYGLPLAVGCAVLFPLAAMDLLIAGAALIVIKALFAFMPFARILARPLLLLIPLAIIALVIFFSIWAVKKTWRWATRPLAPGELT